MGNQVEIWKSYPYIAGVEVSTLGRVRMLDRLVSSEKYTRFTKGRILKQYDRKDGYLQVSFRMNGKPIAKKVHRLVAETFIHNPNMLPMVNHLDCDRTNNNVENLEFCTASYNQQYREKYGISRAEALGHPLFAINLSTLKVLQFKTQHQASRTLGINQGNISNVIKGTQKTAGGYWFVTDDGNAVDVVKSKLHDIGKTGLKI